jgi:hypothetical protein
MTRVTKVAMPPLVAALGYGGLLPFVALAAASVLDTDADADAALRWQSALLAYGAVILSFVGALHWGFAISASGLTERQRNVCFVWSVIPALLAWSTFFLTPSIASMLLAAGFLAHYLQDRRLIRQTDLPCWYLPLRLRLTVVACISLLAAAWAA